MINPLDSSKDAQIGQKKADDDAVTVEAVQADGSQAQPADESKAQE